LDCRHAPSEDDHVMLNYLSHHNYPFIIALTKGDKLTKTQMITTVEEFKVHCKNYSYSDIILTSAAKNIGMDSLSDTMQKFLER
ncbi:MAG: YihA family ribosome biogenesis GTP-binding protein, partial [Oscillospiraceae bacterium]